MKKSTQLSVAFICDDNYVTPTSIAILSLITNKQAATKCKIYVIASSLKDENTDKLKALATKDAQIEIVIASSKGLEHLHTFSKDAICVASLDALLKFQLAELIPNEDKLLYLDGDILVRKDLLELYNTDLESNYAGVVVDSGTIYYKHSFVERVANYFNSGMMLLNLKLFRELGLKETLINEKLHQTDSNLMDQNVFNVVFDSHIKLLPIKYNFLAINLIRAKHAWTIDDINKLYGTAYANFEAIEASACILHFSSRDKPWKFADVYGADDWYKYYLMQEGNAPLERDTLALTKKDPKPEGVLVSIVMPVYNSSEFLADAMESALCQSLSSIEVICVDDGSTDNSLEILQKYQAKDNRIKIITQPNQGQSVARNTAIKSASGTYIYFLDSDDAIATNAMLELYKVATKHNLDTLLFDGSSFFETPELEEQYASYKTYYQHKQLYKGVYNGKQMYSSMVASRDFIVSPCLQFVRRENIIAHDVWYPAGIIHEDNYFFFLNLVNSERIMCTRKPYFLRRVRAHSTMTTTVDNKNIIGYYVCAQKILEYINTHELDHKTELAAVTQAYRHLKYVDAKIPEIDDPIQLHDLWANPMMSDFNYTTFLPVMDLVVTLQSANAKKTVKIRKQQQEIKKLKQQLNNTFMKKLKRFIKKVLRKLKILR